MIDSSKIVTVPTEDIFKQIQKDLPKVGVVFCENPLPAAQHSILVDSADAIEVFTYLRDTDGLKFDFLSNVFGVDYPKAAVADTIAVPQLSETPESEGSDEAGTPAGGFFEVVYQLYSMERKTGEPLVLRQRTKDRDKQVSVTSVQPIFRSAEFQEREAYDLFGIDFTGHPDLRRILMWDEFEDFPMRKDYVNPDDYEYEPTPHADVLKRAEAHYSNDSEEESKEEASDDAAPSTKN